ncbi:hypothetical protein V1514DRAFT_326833 [Lipomyces japonicus]|uniref:uncharacterized protein n=1 Tax=Lipomyces japonicus TaxID=56871 RepID=UPI0034CEE88A
MPWVSLRVRARSPRFIRFPLALQINSLQLRWASNESCQASELVLNPNQAVIINENRPTIVEAFQTLLHKNWSLVDIQHLEKKLGLKKITVNNHDNLAIKQARVQSKSYFKDKEIEKQQEMVSKKRMTEFARNHVSDDSKHDELQNAYLQAQRTRFTDVELVGKVFLAYMKYPMPRPLNMPNDMLESLMSMYQVTEKNNARLRDQYFCLLSDVLDCKMPVSIPEHNTALAYIVYWGSKSQTPRGLQYGRRYFFYLRKYGVLTKNAGPYNTVFAAAVRVKRLKVCHTFLRMMQEDKVDFDMFSYSTVIQFYGSIGKTTLVKGWINRSINNRMVSDTAFIESAISALINCNETNEALNFLSMLESYTIMNGYLPGLLSSTEKKKLIAKQRLLANQRIMHDNDAKSDRSEFTINVSIQDSSYDCFLKHYMHEGNFDGIFELVHRMKFFGLNLRRAYVALFKGFYIHGSSRHGKWGPENLTDVFASVINQPMDFEISRATVLWIIRSFTVVMNDYKLVQQVFEKCLERRLIQFGSEKGVAPAFLLAMEWSRGVILRSGKKQKLISFDDDFENLDDEDM